jgi:FlaA1/EpsC-like NDP-sugar epimerase
MIDYSGFISDPPVKIDVHDWLAYKTVLVTGAGGSIGSEICARLLQYPVGQVVAVGRSEEPLFNLRNKLDSPRLHIKIADIRDVDRVKEVMEENRPNIVFHAAAYKHVGLMEKFEAEAVKNNIFGTINLFDNLPVNTDFIFVSTDKAVNPSSVMGATKRFCEKYLATYRTMIQSTDIVRLGNVIGSSGSVATIFEDCAKKNQPLRVTHADMERFFITPKNAAALIIQAGSFRANSAYVLKMGPAINIQKLAEYIKLVCGSESDIVIDTPGPGEKITEELFDRPVEEIPGKRLFKLANEYINSDEIERFLIRFRSSLEDPHKLRKALFESVENNPDEWRMAL